ncbi:MAG TPA: cytochrome C oxidase subunit IV family protein [Gemmatimonadaceae bacterium]|nr:cytochrome C oxidase subunit IV family protein [Gemmatimonadaceae bacterium]
MTSDHGHDAAAGGHAQGHAEHHGPTTKTYLVVAAVLTLITAVEVYVYYTPFRHSPAFVPTLLVMSALKFFTVVGFYMHLKYDHKLFRTLFGGPFLIAIGTIIALIFLFSRPRA